MDSMNNMDTNGANNMQGNIPVMDNNSNMNSGVNSIPNVHNNGVYGMGTDNGIPNATMNMNSNMGMQDMINNMGPNSTNNINNNINNNGGYMN